MSDDDEVEAPEKPGIPAWVMTFADLMSLLMCFFVLLLSFSQMDVLKFKKLAGSMEKAFGVQRDIVTYEIPKGTSIIAKEFTPGTPEPTPLESMRQQTKRELHQTLYFNKISSRGRDNSGGKGGEAGQGGAEGAGGSLGNIGAAAILAELKKQGSEAEQKGGAKEGEEDKDADHNFQGQISASEGAEDDIAEEEDESEAEMSQEMLQALLEVIQEAEDQAKEDLLQDAIEKAKDLAKDEMEAAEISAIKSAANIADILEDEINRGMVEVEVWDMRVVIRMAEHGAFETAGARLKRSFIPVLDRLRSVFAKLPGEIHVIGHTDNIPVSTKRFRSNWDLSSARAATVAHELLMDEELEPSRLKVVGMAHTVPLYPNTSEENRLKNRRVDIMLVQGDEPVYSQEVVQGLEEVLVEQQELNDLSKAPVGDEHEDFGHKDDALLNMTDEELDRLHQEQLDNEMLEDPMAY